MSNKDGVKISEPPAEDSPESRPKAGNPSSQNGERTYENVLAENKRKSEEISELREQMTEMKETMARIEELREQEDLTRGQKNELAGLEEDFESQRRAILADKRSAPWLRIQKDISANAAKEAVGELSLSHTRDFIEELSEQEGVVYDKMEKNLVKVMKQIDPGGNLELYSRAKKAWKQIQKDREYDKKYEELKKKEALLLESGETAPSSKPKTSASFKDAKESGSMTDYLKSIAEKQAQDKAR